VLTVNQAALTITATNVGKFYGTEFVGTAFTTSGLLNSDTVIGVTLTSTGSAAGAMVAGSPYTIVPSAAVGTGLANYIVNYGNGSLTVNKATLTVTGNNSSMVSGAAVPALSATITGFVHGDTSATVSGVPSLTTTATATSPAGTYPITVATGTLSAANYTFAFVNGTLTVIMTPPPPPPGPTPASISVVSGSGQTGAQGIVLAVPSSYS
jgi:hypothetical protein